MPPPILAIDAGGTSLKSGLVDGDGGLVPGSRRSRPADSTGPLAAVMQAFRGALPEGTALAAIAIAMPGPFDWRDGVSRMPHKYRCLLGLDLRRLLREQAGFPPGIPITFLHDSGAFALGEGWRGAGRGHACLVAATIGTGIGCGVVRDGRLLTAPDGGPLLSLYRRPCRDGILEDWVSGRGVVRAHRACGGSPDAADARAVAGRAAAGEPAAGAAFALVGRLLGESLAPDLAALGASCLVVGGQVARAWSWIAPGLQVALAGQPGLRIACADDLDGAALVGAARAAIAAPHRAESEPC